MCARSRPAARLALRQALPLARHPASAVGHSVVEHALPERMRCCAGGYKKTASALEAACIACRGGMMGCASGGERVARWPTRWVRAQPAAVRQASGLRRPARRGGAQWQQQGSAVQQHQAAPGEARHDARDDTTRGAAGGCSRRKGALVLPPLRRLRPEQRRRASHTSIAWQALRPSNAHADAVVGGG